MVALSQKEIRQRTPWLLMALLLLNFALMAFNARDPETNNLVIRAWTQTIAAPVQSIVSGIGGFGTNFYTNVVNWKTATSENDKLKERVYALEQEIVNNQNLAAENDRLKSLLDLESQTNFKTVAARVIARDPSGWFDTVIINRGRTSGIEVNMPVVTSAGIVGRVIATSPVSSQVQLMTNDKSAAAAIVGQIGNSNAFGTIKGAGNNDLLLMQNVPGTEKVAAGDAVFTTGQEQIYPPGLKVGEVFEVKNGSATIPQTILVKPGASLGALREVSVLLYQRPVRANFDQALPNANKQTGRKK